MIYKWINFIFILLILTCLSQALHAQSTPNASNIQINRPSQSFKAIFLYRPFIPHHWGTLIQYSKLLPNTPNNPSPDTVFQFVFQDKKGIIRVATYHENVKGKGFWEVAIWNER
jgi:hypothetical protein